MERFGIIAANWRRTGTDGLERFTVPPDELAGRLPRLREALGVDELVYLATCNRVEILVVLDAPVGDTVSSVELRRRAFTELVGRRPTAGEAEQMLRLWGGEGALEHLLLVAGGLDSAQLGEREIRGQLRDSHRVARELGISGPLLDWAIDRGLAVAREIERSTHLADGRLSLAGIGLDRVQAHLAERGGRVALVGVSPMTERCGRALVDAGVECSIVNRGADRGEELARRLGVPFRSLDAFLAEPGTWSALVTATGAREPIFGADELRRLITDRSHPPLVVDFGVPPDVDPRAAAALRIPRVGMESINAEADASRGRRQAEVATAREHIDRALVSLRHELAQRATSQVLAELGRRYRRTAHDGVDRLFRRELRHLDADARQAVEAFALNLAKRFAHVPTLGLRALAAEHGHDAVATFLAASDTELAEVLRRDAPPETGEAA
ncbi:MAG: hypothetical protein AAGE94_19220 [Acidobacteriota bacterium]